MFSTTLAAVVVGGLLVPGANNLPGWQADYGKAMIAAVDQQKPLAVFIGSGNGGIGGVVTDGLPAQANQLLSTGYVCVYVNTDTPEGKTLAGQFGLTQGVVISNRGGSVQALRHTGAVTGTDLTGYLTRFSSPALAVTTTEQTGVVTSTSGYTPGATYPAATYPATTYPAFSGGCPGGNCGAVRYYSPYPAFGFGGGCVNGQCR